MQTTTSDHSGDTSATAQNATRGRISSRYVGRAGGRDYINQSGQNLIVETVQTANRALLAFGYTLEQTAPARRTFVEKLRETLLRKRCLPPDTVAALWSSLLADARTYVSSQHSSERD